MFYGVLLKYMHAVADADFRTRLRSLRNLIEASSDEIRAGERNNMPKLLVDVERLIVDGTMHEVKTFNQVQVANELDKAAMLQADPSLQANLYQLEDHEFLRGGLTAFEFDPEKFSQRALAFLSIFNKLTGSGNNPWILVAGALLAKGDYSRKTKRWTGHRFAEFGSPKNEEPWQTLFRGKKGEKQHPAMAPLMALLDDVAAGRLLQEVVDAYLDNPATNKDWRYYFIKYEAMRKGESGRYTLSPSGYQGCMLDKSQMNSYYRDPYLLAMIVESGIKPDRLSKPWPWFFWL